MPIFNDIVALFISLLVILAPFSILAGIVLWVLFFQAENASTKKKLKTATIWCLAGPFVLLLLVLSVWGLASILTGTAKG